MKQTSKKRFRIILAVVLVVLVLGLIWLFRPIGSPSTEEPAASTDIPAESTPQQAIVVSDQDLEQLISGDLTLDDLEQNVDAIVFDPEDASSEDASSSEDSAPSKGGTSAASKPQSTASSGQKDPETGSTSPAASSSASGTSKTDKTDTSSSSTGYEAEIKALLQQVYAVKARGENGLNSCIAAAKAEYKALPSWQQNQATKLMIVASKTGELTALQSSCDKEMDQIVSQMRTILQQNGQSTALADQVMSTYNATKSSRYNELKNKLYS